MTQISRTEIRSITLRHLAMPLEKREGSPSNPSFLHFLTFSSPFFFSPFFLLSFLFCDLLLHFVLSHWGTLAAGEVHVDWTAMYSLLLCFVLAIRTFLITFLMLFSFSLAPPPCHHHVAMLRITGLVPSGPALVAP